MTRSKNAELIYPCYNIMDTFLSLFLRGRRCDCQEVMTFFVCRSSHAVTAAKTAQSALEEKEEAHIKQKNARFFVSSNEQDWKWKQQCLFDISGVLLL